MPKRTRIIQRVPRGKVAFVAVAVFGAFLPAYQRGASDLLLISAQSRQQRRVPNRATTANSAVTFRHATHRDPKTTLKCTNCHTTPTAKAADVVPMPTPSTKTLPYHDKCLDCHRSKDPPLFFRGATPGICRVCHTRSSPRLTKNDLNPLPEQSAELILGDLSIKFDHSSTSHLSDCTKCHVDVTQLDVDKADAPIATCASSSCHSKAGTQPAFQDQMLKMEDNDIVSGKNEHTCNGCHATKIAGKSPPCTHIKLFDPDGSFFTGAEFSKSVKLIAEKCK